MRKILSALAGVSALVALAAPAAAQNGTAVTVEPDGCGVATVTFINNTQWTFYGDYRIPGDTGRPTDGLDPELVIEEGPMQGQQFGLEYHPIELPPGETVTETVEIAEDRDDGLVEVQAWINRGPEQRAFATLVSTDVETDCEAPADENPGDGQPSGSPTSTPPSETGTPDPDDGETTGPTGTTEPTGTTDATGTTGPTAGETSTSTTAPVVVEDTAGTGRLAETGASSALPWLLGIGGVAVLGGAALLLLVRRRHSTR